MATGLFRCENGLVIEMDLPLPPVFDARLKRGEITRVDDLAGDPAKPAAELPTPPAGEIFDSLKRTRAELASALDRVEELQAERDKLVAERDQARAELDELRTKPPAKKAASARATAKAD
jgi:hypothetical protein